VVKLKCEWELAREKKDFKAKFKKRKEKAEKDGGKKPRKTGSPLMTYACACHVMWQALGARSARWGDTLKSRMAIQFVKPACASAIPVFSFTGTLRGWPSSELNQRRRKQEKS
jgi:hypothetical protein